jgi:predicted RNA binding protein YcfA (HicA-like mRNA interferase family)
MARLPSVSSRKVVKALRSFGWEVARRESSHVIMVKEGEMATLSP